MAQFKNVMEIFKGLPKTNCRDCNETTCLAFAGAVFTGRKPLGECPHLTDELRERGKTAEQTVLPINQEYEQQTRRLKGKIAAMDLQAAAIRVGGQFSRDKLTLKVMGKGFGVTTRGEVFADIHVHEWIEGPFLEYVVSAAGPPLANEWFSIRELKGGQDWYRFFGQMCEKPMQRLADQYPDLFEDMMHLFDGKPAADQQGADIAVELLPLPKIPMRICYWKPEDGLASSLSILFDKTASENLSMGALYALGAGFAKMLAKVALRHGWK